MSSDTSGAIWDDGEEAQRQDHIAKLETKIKELEHWKANYTPAMLEFRNACKHMIQMVEDFNTLQEAAKPFTSTQIQGLFYDEHGNERTGNNFGGPYLPGGIVRIDDCRRMVQVLKQINKYKEKA